MAPFRCVSATLPSSPFCPWFSRRALNRRAAFYSGLSGAWAQRHLDSINWCLGIRVSFSGCKGEQKGLSSFGGSLGGSFFDREIKTTPNESFYQSKRRQKYLPGSFSGTWGTSAWVGNVFSWIAQEGERLKGGLKLEEALGMFWESLR